MIDLVLEFLSSSVNINKQSENQEMKIIGKDEVKEAYTSRKVREEVLRPR